MSSNFSFFIRIEEETNQYGLFSKVKREGYTWCSRPEDIIGVTDSLLSVIKDFKKKRKVQPTRLDFYQEFNDFSKGFLVHPLTPVLKEEGRPDCTIYPRSIWMIREPDGSITYRAGFYNSTLDQTPEIVSESDFIYILKKMVVDLYKIHNQYENKEAE